MFLDSTLCEKDDLDLIKYLKLFPKMFCEVSLFKGQGYNSENDTDHFFNDEFQLLIDSVVEENKVISFSKFKESSDFKDKYNKMLSYISETSNDKTCLKWSLLHAFHFALMPFLTRYGYDFQKTSEDKLINFSKKLPQNILLPNVSNLINDYQLNTKELKLSTNVLKKHYKQ